MGPKGGEVIKLSYVLPTYNRVEYLGECLQTLVDQDYDKGAYEIIIVDDGSEDSTQELVEFFKENYPNISFYKTPHLGVEAARNLGNSKARGEYIGVCDSDDLYHPLRTKITLDYFSKHPDVDLLNGSYLEINHRGLGVRKEIIEAKKFKKEEFYRGGRLLLPRQLRLQERKDT